MDAFGIRSAFVSKVKPSSVPRTEPGTLTVSCDNSDKLQLKTFLWRNSVYVNDRLQISEARNTSDPATLLQLFHDVQASGVDPAGDCYPQIRPECAHLDGWPV